MRCLTTIELSVFIRVPSYSIINSEAQVNPALAVATVDKRRRIPQAAINEIVRQIVAKFRPHKIIFFGSYAYGTPRPESDVDLLVVMETPLREAQQAIQICQQIDYLFGLDLLVYTPRNLAQRLAWGDSFLREVMERGKVLYESTNG